MARRKFQIGDHVRANDNAPSDYRAHVGVVTEIGPGKSEYRVEYNDSGHAYGYLMSWWLDRLLPAEGERESEIVAVLR
jgi:hypothetical protein